MSNANYEEFKRRLAIEDDRLEQRKEFVDQAARKGLVPFDSVKEEIVQAARSHCLDSATLTDYVSGSLLNPISFFRVWKHIYFLRCAYCMADIAVLRRALPPPRMRLSWVPAVLVLFIITSSATYQLGSRSQQSQPGLNVSFGPDKGMQGTAPGKSPSGQMPEAWSAESLLKWLVAPDPDNLTEVKKRIVMLETYLGDEEQPDISLHLKLLELYKLQKKHTNDKPTLDVLDQKINQQRQFIAPLLEKELGGVNHGGKSR